MRLTNHTEKIKHDGYLMNSTHVYLLCKINWLVHIWCVPCTHISICYPYFAFCAIYLMYDSPDFLYFRTLIFFLSQFLALVFKEAKSSQLTLNYTIYVFTNKNVVINQHIIICTECEMCPQLREPPLSVS